ncbi:MAG: hypothetical protein JWM14_1753, partial [Chitinophagaceae bacterium]|nr:hypothetical protein [Chitinophagaceae bacterium]
RMASKILFTFLLLTLLTSCSSSPKEQAHPSVTVADTTIVLENGESSKEEIDSTLQEQEGDMDCVFDTSTFKFTTEALLEYDRNLDYTWDDKEKQAIVPFTDGDTLILHIGGCNHFSYWAELKTEASFFSNEKYLMDKAVWMAKNFFSNGFDDGFVKFIRTKQYTLDRNDETMKAYSITTDSTIQENEIYDGISVEKMGDRLKLGIHGYVN